MVLELTSCVIGWPQDEQSGMVEKQCALSDQSIAWVLSSISASISAVFGCADIVKAALWLV
jgi:hypothetical protein